MAKKKQSAVSVKDSIGYKGQVTIKVAHGNKVIKTMRNHNEGQFPLFEFIMYTLAGDYQADKAPKYLNVFNSAGAKITTRPVLANSAVDYTTENNECSVTLSFVVPYSTLTQYNDIRTFKIYSNENYNSDTDSSASITLTNAEEISSTSNLIVAWKMTIGNK